MLTDIEMLTDIVVNQLWLGVGMAAAFVLAWLAVNVILATALLSVIAFNRILGRAFWYAWDNRAKRGMATHTRLDKIYFKFDFVLLRIESMLASKLGFTK